jgi:dihydrofolate reductase
MRTVTAVESVTLDGVMQGLGRPDEDPRGGFAEGGWGPPYADPVMAEAMGRDMAGTGGIVLGRRTYLDFFGYWPRQDDNPYTDVLNATQKHVASRTLTGPLPWQNSSLLAGDAAQALAALKQKPGGDLVILGSGALVRSLLPAGVIDTVTLLIHPLILGSGRRLFADAGPRLGLRLRDTVTTTTGVVIATYAAGSGPARGA